MFPANLLLGPAQHPSAQTLATAGPPPGPTQDPPTSPARADLAATANYPSGRFNRHPDATSTICSSTNSWNDLPLHSHELHRSRTSTYPKFSSSPNPVFPPSLSICCVPFCQPNSVYGLGQQSSWIYRFSKKSFPILLLLPLPLSQRRRNLLPPTSTTQSTSFRSKISTTIFCGTSAIRTSGCT
jgi:hypothetical protein